MLPEPFKPPSCWRALDDRVMAAPESRWARPRKAVVRFQVGEFAGSAINRIHAGGLERLGPLAHPGFQEGVARLRLLRLHLLPGGRQYLLSFDECIIVGLKLLVPDADLLEVADRAFVIGHDPIKDLAVQR